MTLLALATCSALPALDSDDADLVDALRDAGFEPRTVVWDDPSVDWSAFRLVVLRSVWDYWHHRPRFLAWATRVAQVTTLVNPLELVRWNTHKRYLRDLEARGISIVPTAWVDAPCDVDALLAARAWGEAVLKPAVSAGADETYRIRRGDAANAARLARVLARSEAMIQPYLAAVEGYGERSLLFFDGHFSHAIRKRPALGGAPDDRGPEEAVTPREDELAFAARVLAALPKPPVYARVDVIPLGDPSGPALALMEIELVEPRLFFAASRGTGAAARFSGALARAAGRTS